MYMCKYFHVEKVHGYGTLFLVKRVSSSGGVFGTLFKIGQFGILWNDFLPRKAKKIRVNVET